MEKTYGQTWLLRISLRLLRLVEDVPPELAACEFDCREPNCRHGEWQSCQRRKQRDP
ncbi:MAG: hypothetical protein JSU87_05660 [Gemmatimonadota bacterium]|nr:MAG: hypothetical protein JSU87_05660 [Gemmatimonadota bacterium]